ncbi:multimerin-2-like isoform X2 [Stigmatopora argus]
MASVRFLFLLLAFPASAGGDVRARDPEVEEEEEEETEDWGDAEATEETPLMQDGGNYPARSGNWCAFVQKRMVSMAVACGTEKYTIKSQSPCPSGTPDCHLVMYKLSTRPLYKQKQKVTTALLWRCCPGHGGDNCDHTVGDSVGRSENQTEAGSLHAVHAPGSSGEQSGIQPHRQNPNSEQNDHHGGVNFSLNASQTAYPVLVSNQEQVQHPEDVLNLEQERVHHPGLVPTQDHPQHPFHVHNQGHAQYPGHSPDPVQYPVHTANQDHAQHPGHEPNRDNIDYAAHVPNWDKSRHAGHVPNRDHVKHPLQVQDRDPAQRPIHVQNQDHFPQVASLLMSQLRPTLEYINRSLERLEQRADDLARDAARLEDARRRRDEEQAERRRRTDAEVERVARLLAELRRELESGLHSQRATLHFNVSSLKTDLDLKIKRHNKMLQASLQAMNASLAELKLDQEAEQGQDQDQEQAQDQAQDQDQEAELPLVISQGSASSATLWEAIERLDSMVVNNTVKAEVLAEDLAATSDGLEELRRAGRALGERLKQTARDCQVRFMETGLEVEAAKVAVLERVEQLAGNLSRQGQRLQELDVDVDDLYTLLLYKNTSSAAAASCDCRHLDEALDWLRRGVANATELAHEQRRLLGEARRAAAQREASLEAVRVGLRRLTERTTSEEGRTAGLEASVRLLNVRLGERRPGDGVTPSEEIKGVLSEMKRLSASFNSLLKDAIRHSDVLEILLGEEVLEFLEWPVHDQEAHSIPALREDIRSLRESLRPAGGPVDEAEEEPSADEPSSRWPQGAAGNRRGASGTSHDGGDLWKLETSVEELRSRLLKMEEEKENEEEEMEEGYDHQGAATLRTEVSRLKRGLEDHLRTFKSVFSNADVLERSHAPLELDKLYQMMAGKEKKKKKKRGGATDRRRHGSDA